MTNLEVTIHQLKDKYVTLDCNIFVLYVIGVLGKHHISKFKRTQVFREQDFDLLVTLIKRSKVILTPNVVTEASNLLEAYNFKGQNVGLIALKEILQELNEKYEDSRKLILIYSFMKFGLSDSSIDNLCQSSVIAITVDFPLFGYLLSRSYPVINFNHIRSDHTLK